MASRPSLSAVQLLFLAAALSCSAPDDPEYQSYRQAGGAEQVAKAQLWSVRLPYPSGTQLEIIAGDSALWTIERRPREAYLTKIVQDAQGRPGKVVHAAFRHVNSLQILDDIFVVRENLDARECRVTLLDRNDLSVRFAATLPYSSRFGDDHSGQTRLGDYVLLHQAVEWIETQGDQSTPHIDYHLHVIDLVRRRAASHDFSTAKNRDIDAQFARCQKRRRTIDDCVYGFTKFDVASDSKLLVSLVNPAGDALDLSLQPAIPFTTRLIASIDGPEPPPPTRRGKVAAEEPEHKPAAGKEAVKLGAKSYQIRQVEILPGGPVALLEEERPSPAGERVPMLLVGVPLADVMQPLWQQPFPPESSELLADQRSDAVFFCELTNSGFAVRGVSAKDGKPVRGFPANFRAQMQEGAWRDAHVVGTALDTLRGVVYIHDVQENRIVCSGLGNAR